MSKKKHKLKFLVDERVTFKNEFEQQMFGFFYIDSIIVRHEKILYQLYQLDDNGEHVLACGLWKEDDLIRACNTIQPRSAHKLNKIKKKLKRLFKIKKQEPKKRDLPYLDLILVYRVNGEINIIRTSKFKNKDDTFNYVLEKYPTATFVAYQMLGYANPKDEEKLELEYSKLFERYNSSY